MKAAIFLFRIEGCTVSHVREISEGMESNSDDEDSTDSGIKRELYFKMNIGKKSFDQKEYKYCPIFTWKKNIEKNISETDNKLRKLPPEKKF